MSFLLLLTFLNLVFGSIVSKRSFDAKFAYTSVLSTTWSTFWHNEYQAFDLNDPSCNPNFSYAAVWDVAVAGKAIVDSGDVQKTTQVINSLYKFQNSEGWFTSSPGGSDIYTDDNSQVLWVFLDAYKLTQKEAYLNTAVNLMHLIQTQWSQIGGITWQKDATYVASISTTEAALSAVKVYEYNNDKTLLTFANSCLTWLDEHLTDPSDGFYYDGINKDTWQVNKGKLTYTVGTAISTYSYLYKFTGDATYLKKATKMASATLSSSTFLNNNGAWNNDLCYVHLLFCGFADLITIGGKTSYTSALVDQANFIYLFDKLDSGDYSLYTKAQSLYEQYVKITGDSKSVNYNYNPDNFCNGDVNKPRKSVLDDGSAAQIFYSVVRVS
ncbi:hypothetical protein KGF56_002664 [Candida oxycetoniae]|uniref:Glycoside hydrolase family 76 protein n=1 Tax=Candida oxycetoniae TaxID=497107 RepID=A0AAI9WXM5_9ASCO|nr:uncharacterized protein KGF56_002664 [Candida oxycetoniae]KAI3404472.2 hypothetical protein KGF56_002664 [Candida oxycetoniae]